MDEIRDEAEQRAVEMLKESPPSLVDADAASRGLRKANERGTLWQRCTLVGLSALHRAAWEDES